eukprot:evm.model.scf_884EXC.5 EVM.evm.TU.scf_884EXC.5   scf_884EXC:32586-33750(-)
MAGGATDQALATASGVGSEAIMLMGSVEAALENLQQGIAATNDISDTVKSKLSSCPAQKTVHGAKEGTSPPSLATVRTLLCAKEALLAPVKKSAVAVPCNCSFQ